MCIVISVGIFTACPLLSLRCRHHACLSLRTHCDYSSFSTHFSVLAWLFTFSLVHFCVFTTFQIQTLSPLLKCPFSTFGTMKYLVSQMKLAFWASPVWATCLRCTLESYFIFILGFPLPICCTQTPVSCKSCLCLPFKPHLGVAQLHSFPRKGALESSILWHFIYKNVCISFIYIANLN